MKVKERANYQIDTLRDSLFFPYTRKALKNPPSFLEELVKSQGSVVKVKIARTRYLILQHPDLIKQVLVDNHKAYEKVGITTILRYFFGSGLVTSNGEEWAHKRKIMQPAFHKQRLSNLLEVIDEETTKLVKRLNQYSSNNPINITDEMLRLNISIITRSLFGGTTKKERIILFEVLSKLTSFATKRISSIVKTPLGWPTAANKEFQKDCKEFDGIIYSLIERRTKHRSAYSAGSYNDLLDMLLDDYENLESLQFNQQLRDDITTIFMAGHDTTAQTLSWLFYEVAKNPAISKDLYDEVQENIKPGPLDIDTLSKMLYTEQVIQETLRNYPSIIAVQRKPISEDCFNGIKVDSSTNILINIY
ncbi:MAG: cytochrome P450, partial [Flavobacteriaceae bacterium]|nr:cytochrome P450 [Flavobacteriaceae bacterium]